MITLEQCEGCDDDFYNYKHRSSTGRCWSAPTGVVRTRFRIGTWDRPDEPGAFTEVEVPSCRRERGSHFYDKLPDFVRVEDVVRRTTERVG